MPREMPYWERLYRAHLQERKELAFAHWKASGYRDKAAHNEYLDCYKALTINAPLEEEMHNPTWSLKDQPPDPMTNASQEAQRAALKELREAAQAVFDLLSRRGRGAFELHEAMTRLGKALGEQEFSDEEPTRVDTTDMHGLKEWR